MYLQKVACLTSYSRQERNEGRKVARWMVETFKANIQLLINMNIWVTVAVAVASIYPLTQPSIQAFIRPYQSCLKFHSGNLT